MPSSPGSGRTLILDDAHAVYLAHHGSPICHCSPATAPSRVSGVADRP
jgi:hypothetical protein